MALLVEFFFDKSLVESEAGLGTVTTGNDKKLITGDESDLQPIQLSILEAVLVHRDRGLVPTQSERVDKDPLL